MSAEVLAALIGLLAGIAGSAASYLAIRRKVRLELLSHFRRELRSARIVAYKGLWQATEPLALYAPPADLTLDALTMLERNLSRQYFRHGVFLSTDSRDRYFLLQDALKIVIEGWSARGDEAPLRSRLDRFTLAEAGRAEQPIIALLELDRQPGGKGGSKTRTAEKLASWQTGDGMQDFHLLRILGSRLRSQLAHDLETREATWAGLERPTAT